MTDSVSVYEISPFNLGSMIKYNPGIKTATSWEYICRPGKRIYINGPSRWGINGGISCGHILSHTPMIPTTRQGRSIFNYIQQYKEQEQS